MSTIWRGTTPTHTFTPTSTIVFSNITALSIAYAQNGTVKVEKELEDVTFTSSAIQVTLTEEDTLALADYSETEIQIRFKIGTTAFVSDIITVDTGRILKDGELE